MGLEVWDLGLGVREESITRPFRHELILEKTVFTGLGRNNLYLFVTILWTKRRR